MRDATDLLGWLRLLLPVLFIGVLHWWLVGPPPQPQWVDNWRSGPSMDLRDFE